MVQVVPGAYISAGRQGSLRKGEVQAPRNLPSNPETLQSSAYRCPSQSKLHSEPHSSLGCVGGTLDAMQMHYLPSNTAALQFSDGRCSSAPTS